MPKPAQLSRRPLPPRNDPPPNRAKPTTTLNFVVGRPPSSPPARASSRARKNNTATTPPGTEPDNHQKDSTSWARFGPDWRIARFSNRISAKLISNDHVCGGKSPDRIDVPSTRLLANYAVQGPRITARHLRPTLPMTDSVFGIHEGVPWWNDCGSSSGVTASPLSLE